MNMNLIIEKLNRLGEIDHNWIDVITGKTRIENKEMEAAYLELWSALREGFKKNQEQVKKILTDNEQDLNWLLEEVEQSLEVYFIFAFLRKLQEVNDKTVEEILDYLLDNAIIYFDPQFSNEYKQFGLESQQEFVNIAKGLNWLIDYYISCHYTKTAMQRDLEDETGLNSKLCKHIAEKVWENYQVLQAEFIINFMKKSDTE